jgi:YHS domain-containing protein
MRMRTSKRVFVAMGFASLLTGMLTISAFAEDGKALISADKDRIAIQGYDTVAYFTLGQPTKGQANFEYSWHGARWLFASAEHRDLFSRNPETFAPRFGGFCALAMANGVRVTPDPEAWIIVDGRLYLNAGKLTAEDRAQYVQGAAIPKAEENWAKLSQ